MRTKSKQGCYFVAMYSNTWNDWSLIEIRGAKYVLEGYEHFRFVSRDLTLTRAYILKRITEAENKLSEQRTYIKNWKPDKT